MNLWGEEVPQGFIHAPTNECGYHWENLRKIPGRYQCRNLVVLSFYKMSPLEGTG